MPVRVRPGRLAHDRNRRTDRALTPGIPVRIRVGRLHASRAWRPCTRFVSGRPSVRFRLEALTSGPRPELQTTVCACIAARCCPAGPTSRYMSGPIQRRGRRGSGHTGRRVAACRLSGILPVQIRARPHGVGVRPQLFTRSSVPSAPPKTGRSARPVAARGRGRTSTTLRRGSKHIGYRSNTNQSMRTHSSAPFTEGGQAPSHSSTTRPGGELWTTRSTSQLGCVGW